MSDFPQDVFLERSGQVVGVRKEKALGDLNLVEQLEVLVFVIAGGGVDSTEERDCLGTSNLVDAVAADLGNPLPRCNQDQVEALEEPDEAKDPVCSSDLGSDGCVSCHQLKQVSIEAFGIIGLLVFHDDVTELVVIVDIVALQDANHMLTLQCLISSNQHKELRGLPQDEKSHVACPRQKVDLGLHLSI